MENRAAAEIDVIKVRIERQKADLRLAETETQVATVQLAFTFIQVAMPPKFSSKQGLKLSQQFPLRAFNKETREMF